MLKTLKRFGRLLLRWKKAFFAFIIATIIASVLGSLSPYLYKIMVETIPSQNYQLLFRIILAFVGLRILSNLVHALSYYLGDKVAIPADAYLREKIFHHVQELEFAFHANKKTGSLISAFKRGHGAFWALFLNLREILEVVVGLLVAVFFFYHLSLWLVLLMLALFAANVGASIFLIRLNVERKRVLNRAEDRITGIIADNFLNYETVKYFAGEERERIRLKKRLQALLKKAWSYTLSFRLMDVTIGTLSAIGMFLMLWLSLVKFKAGDMTSGDLIMVASFTTSFYYQFFHLLYQARNIAKNFEDLTRYFGLLDKDMKIEDPAHPKKIEKPEGRIVFDNVTFDYPQGKEEALRSLDLEIKPGEVVAFVGRSGAGKTTLVKLLFRLYELREGRILIDGVDIKELAKKELRRIIGIVPQEPILFNNTIGFNIAFGADDPTQEEVEKAARMANIYQFIQGLPEKFETRVGERGIKLSGGQKQRLAIARMILADPKIIIFDEATSQLDSESEALIQEALWEVAENRTVLIIAHRFSTILAADTIVVLEDGRLVEKGSHRELLRKQGIYHHLWRFQSEKPSGWDPELPT